MIQRIEKDKNYNPVREHLRILTINEKIENKNSRLVELINDSNFDSRLSRILIFCTKREDTESLAAYLQDNSNWSFRDKIEAFHAGKGGEERTHLYSEFLKGDIPILVATKAFGMGMDIPNIHGVYHMDPPSSLEDYLQEVGRAGRDEKLYLEAGFSLENPIKCIILANEGDFKKIRDRQLKSSLSFKDIIQIFQLLKRHHLVHKSLQNVSLVPLNFLSQFNEFNARKDPHLLLKLALYWLESLKRIEIGNLVPAFLTIVNSQNIRKPFPKELQLFQKLLIEVQDGTRPDSAYIYVSVREALSTTHSKNYVQLYKVLINLVKGDFLQIDQSLSIDFQKNRLHEVSKIVNNYDADQDFLNTFSAGKQNFNNDPLSFTLPEIEAYFNLADLLLKDTGTGRAVSIEGDRLDSLLQKVIGNHLTIEKLRPFDYPNPDKTLINLSNSFRKGYKIRAIFRLMNTIKGLKVKPTFDDSKFVLTISNYSESASKQLSEMKSSCYKVINRVFRVKSGREHKFNIFVETIGLDIPDHDVSHLERILIFLRSIGYLDFHGAIFPTALEMKLISDSNINTESNDGSDLKVFKEFSETKKLKRLRTDALECMLYLKTQEQKAFIEEYFQCEKSDGILSLLEKFCPPEGQHLLQSLREERYQIAVLGEEDGEGNKKGGLNPLQLKVFNAPVNSSLCVTAGPGSGKTHTLILRLVKMIHEVGILPRNILVLAYNRAVVAELKHRIHDLLQSLGYGQLANELRVHTFHSLVQYCIPEKVKELQVDKWIRLFNSAFDENSFVTMNRLGTLEYIFVDEFQDITEERYSMLKRLAGDTAKIVVIGDPDQSIYGYERLNENSAIGAEPFFLRFKKEMNVNEEYSLAENYRSHPLIVQFAEELIKLNKSRINRQRMVPSYDSIKFKGKTGVESIEIETFRSDSYLDYILEHFDRRQNPDTEISEIAILFRSNDELFRAFSNLKADNRFSGFKIRVQGESSEINNSREIAGLIDMLGLAEQEVITKELNHRIQELISRLSSRFPNWNHEILKVIDPILQEFWLTNIENPSFGEFKEYLAEMCSNDSGQLYKLMQIWKDNDIKSTGAELVFSTIHKVKGLEFDAVIVPFSYSELPFRNMRLNDENILTELLEEEIRLRYVAITRARKLLVIINCERERALLSGLKYEQSEKVISKLGIPCNSSLENLVITFAANSNNVQKYLNFSSDDDYQIYMRDSVGYGDEVGFTKISNSWFVFHKGRKIAKLSKGKLVPKLEATGRNHFSGLVITGVRRFYFKDTVLSDTKNGTNFSEMWSQKAKQRGWIYIPEFAGYAR